MIKTRLLVADDDRLVRYSLTHGLRGAGYEVVEACDAEEAMQLCKANRPDLALLDIRLPGKSGIELGECLKTEVAVPFLFLSAYSDNDTVAQAVAIGALGYLVKPLDIMQILPTVETALARAAEIRKLRESSENLSAALRNSRETSIAVGLLMERYELKAESAFELLRSYARNERCKIIDVATEILLGENALEKLHAHIEASTEMLKK